MMIIKIQLSYYLLHLRGDTVAGLMTSAPAPSAAWAASRRARGEGAAAAPRGVAGGVARGASAADSKQLGPGIETALTSDLRDGAEDPEGGDTRFGGTGTPVGDETI
jgi:hypothetical protein